MRVAIGIHGSDIIVRFTIMYLFNTVILPEIKQETTW